MYKRYFKRVMDIFCSLLAIIVFSWLYIIVAVCVRIKLGSPVIFAQERPGKDGKVFKVYKFRTMTNKCDEKGELLPDELRQTKFGTFLRKMSLDEIPQAFNILKGDMSILGPRPMMQEYLDDCTEEELKRLSVRPGLSGLAQVNGRNDLPYKERFALDVEYIGNITFWGDVKLIFRTVAKVFKSEGVQYDENIDKRMVSESSFYHTEHLQSDEMKIMERHS